MKIKYDSETDSLTIVFRDSQIVESDELRPNLIADFDDAGNIVSLELLEASQVVGDPGQVVYERSA